MVMDDRKHDENTPFGFKHGRSSPQRARPARLLILADRSSNLASFAVRRELEGHGITARRSQALLAQITRQMTALERRGGSVLARVVVTQATRLRQVSSPFSQEARKKLSLNKPTGSLRSSQLKIITSFRTTARSAPATVYFMSTVSIWKPSNACRKIVKAHDRPPLDRA
jgi:hypothetical protein